MSSFVETVRGTDRVTMNLGGSCPPPSPVPSARLRSEGCSRLRGRLLPNSQSGITSRKFGHRGRLRGVRVPFGTGPTSRAGTFWGANFYPRTLFRSWFLRWKHTEYWPKVPSSWGKFLQWKQGFRLFILNKTQYYVLPKQDTFIINVTPNVTSNILPNFFANGQLKRWATVSTESSQDNWRKYHFPHVILRHSCQWKMTCETSFMSVNIKGLSSKCVNRMVVMIRYNIDSHTQQCDICRYHQKILRYEYDSILEYIALYYNIWYHIAYLF